MKVLVTSHNKPSLPSENDAQTTLTSCTSYLSTILEIFYGHEVLRNLLINDQQRLRLSANGKLSNFLLEFTEVNITTPSSESWCGVPLNASKTYLISGQIMSGQLEINACNLISPWDSVTDQVKAGLYGDYDCRCNIETGMNSINGQEKEVENTGDENSVVPKISSTCFWEMFPGEPIDECALNFLTCRKLVHPMEFHQEQQECVWVQGRGYELCTSTSTPPVKNT